MKNPVTMRSLILRILDVSPGYGKDLVQRIKNQTNGKIKITLSGVYPVLKDLEEKGFIFRDSRDGRAEIFKITTNGKKEAAKEREFIALLFGLN